MLKLALLFLCFGTTVPAEETRLGIASGITSVDISNAAYDRVNSVFYLGLSADVLFNDYLGIESEAYYGSGSVETFQNGRIVQTQVGRLEQIGAMANVRAQYPLVFEESLVTPKFGVGFGYITQDLKNDYQTAAQNTLAQIGTSAKSFGLYATIGLEFEPLAELLFAFDYAFSLASTREMEGGLRIAQIPLTVQDPGFSRLRASGYYRLSDSFLLGAQFIQRRLTGTSGVGSSSLSPSQNHFLLSLMFNF